MMLHTVLVPTDFTEEADLVLAFVRGLPALGVRRALLAHVVPAIGLEGPVIAAAVDDVRDKLRARVPQLEAAGLGVEVRVPAGDPFEELSALASELHVDAIVCGTNAKPLVDQLLAGSVSERLLRDSDTPMLLARFDLLKGQDDPADLVRRFGEKLILATDFSLSSSRAFTRILELPAGTVKHLFISHAIDPALTGERLRRAEEGAEFHLKNMQAMAAQSGVTASVSIRRAPAIQGLLEEIDERRASGVVTGTRGRNAVQEMILGSVSMTVLRQASCPVMVVH